jgi:shikimate dehydrogenase
MAAVVGWPIGHSRSPLIHGHWLARYGIDGRYDRIGVPPERADAFFAGFAGEGLAGANVTIPHKEVAARHAELDDVASALGAVNTVWLEDGALHATNTDVYGFLANCDEASPGWTAPGRPAVVLGAGGAARSIVFALASRGFEPVVIVNRTAERAERLARGYPTARVVAWSSRDAALADAAFLVNTTSLGMAGQPPLDIELAGLAADAVVCDIVYAPLVTDLLARAAARGFGIVDGLGMLLHQAVPGFSKWFGRRPVVDAELRAIIEADLVGTR